MQLNNFCSVCVIGSGLVLSLVHSFPPVAEILFPIASMLIHSYLIYSRALNASKYNENFYLRSLVSLF